MNVVDQYNDPAFGVLFRQITQMPALGDFVKSASIDQAEAETLPSTAFAWPDERRFPIHTAEHAALSYAYAKTASVPAPVLDALKQALEVYGVPESVFAQPETKVASLSDEDFLLPDLRLFPVKTAADLSVAQRQVVENLSKLDLPHRAMACGNLVKKAGEYGVDLHPEVVKLAGFVVSSTETTRRWLEARAGAAKDPTYKVAYQTLADGLRAAPPEVADRGDLLKLAAAVAELDERSGLDLHYDRRLPDALRTVFNTEKQAAECVELCGAQVPLRKLAGLPASFWEDLGGPELSREIAPGGRVDVSKLAEVVGTLPLDLKVILKSQVR